MAAEFVSLADWLDAGSRAAARADAETDATPAGGAGVEHSAGDAASDAAAEEALRPCDSDIGDALRDARLFRARLADAFDDASLRLLRELASDVLARELQLAPCDLPALVRRAFERAPVVRVRVAPGDIARVAGVPVVADPALVAGDAVVELAGGALDARLGVRLASVLESFA